jgi:hypothetical protein
MSGDGWHAISPIDLEAFNADVTGEFPIADVVIHHPSNLDPAHRRKVTLDLVVDGVARAKEVFAAAGVHVRLAAVRTGPVDPDLQAIDSTDASHRSPGHRFVGMYRAAERRPHRLSEQAEAAFAGIIEDDELADRTIHLVTLQDVFMTFLEQVDERTWHPRVISTGGLSFPGYMYGSTIPRHLRGVISISDLTKSSSSWKTVAHELGHKLLNVSHEYRDMAPAHEIRAEGGLMIYGEGVEIAAGRAGRFHLERLHRSPFLYRIASDGTRAYNPDYAEDGFYHDPIYDGLCMDDEPAPEWATGEGTTTLDSL